MQTQDVIASVNYLADLSIKPVTYNPPAGTGMPRRVGNYRDFDVRIADARPEAAHLSLDRQGVRLVEHQTAVRDFLDSAIVRDVYYPEVEALLRRETGAARIVIFDHTVRSGRDGVARGLRTPVFSVHNDYTERSGPQRLRELICAEDAERALRGRVAEYNVGRNIADRPIERTPLGFVDSRTLAPRDLAVCDLVYADRTGEIYQGVRNADHR